jgi:hypothetical protein
MKRGWYNLRGMRNVKATKAAESIGGNLMRSMDAGLTELQALKLLLAGICTAPEMRISRGGRGQIDRAHTQQGDVTPEISRDDRRFQLAPVPKLNAHLRATHDGCVCHNDAFR